MGTAVMFYGIRIQQDVYFTCPCGREALLLLLYPSTGKRTSGVVQRQISNGYRHGKLQIELLGTQWSRVTWCPDTWEPLVAADVMDVRLFMRSLTC